MIDIFENIMITVMQIRISKLTSYNFCSNTGAKVFFQACLFLVGQPLLFLALQLFEAGSVSRAHSTEFGKKITGSGHTGRGNIKIICNGAILNVQNNDMQRGNIKYSKRGNVWWSRGKINSGKKVIKLLCHSRLRVNINFDRVMQ